MEYKGFTIEKYNKEYIVYFSDDFGDNGVFNSLDNLYKYVDAKLKLKEENKRFYEKQNLIEKEKQKKHDLKFKVVNEYLTKFTPLQKGKILKTLSVNGYYHINDKNLYLSRFEFIQLLINKKFTPKIKVYDKYNNKKEMWEKFNKEVLENPENKRTWDITKTEYKYSLYLKNLEDLEQTQSL